MCDFVCIIILSCFKCSCVYLTEVKWNKHFCQNYMKRVFEHRNLKTSKRIISERSPKISKWMLFLESLSRDTFLILEQSRVSQPAGQSYSENRKTIKLLCYSSSPSHIGMVISTSVNAEGALAQWIFIWKHLFPLVRVQLFRGNMRTRPHSENLEWHKHCQMKTGLVVRLLFITGLWVGDKKQHVFFLFFTHKAHSRKWLCGDVGRH